MIRVKLRPHSARSAAIRRAASGWPRSQRRRAQSRHHAFCIEHSHSAADRAATEGNALEVEKSSTLRAFPSVAARSAAVDGGRERKMYHMVSWIWIIYAKFSYIRIFIRSSWSRGQPQFTADHAVSRWARVQPRFTARRAALVDARRALWERRLRRCYHIDVPLHCQFTVQLNTIGHKRRPLALITSAPRKASADQTNCGCPFWPGWHVIRTRSPPSAIRGIEPTEVSTPRSPTWQMSFFIQYTVKVSSSANDLH